MGLGGLKTYSQALLVGRGDIVPVVALRAFLFEIQALHKFPVSNPALEYFKKNFEFS